MEAMRITLKIPDNIPGNPIPTNIIAEIEQFLTDPWAYLSQSSTKLIQWVSYNSGLVV